MHKILAPTVLAVFSLVPSAQVAAQAALDHTECGTTATPEIVERWFDEITASFNGSGPPIPGGPNSPNERYYIPTTVHVVRSSSGNGGMGALGVANTLFTANQAFAEVGFEFCQVGEIRYIDDDSFFDCVCGSEQGSLRFLGIPNTMNIFFVPRLVGNNGGGLCGLATYPGSGNPGIVMQNSCAGLGRSTIVHEIGHFFDLLHTHDRMLGRECADGSNCGFAGDLLCDTPADPNLLGRVTQSCEYVGPTGGHCPGDTATLNPAVDNYMSYSRSSCRSSFTPGQILRMQRALLTARPELARPACLDLDFGDPVDLVRASITPEGNELSGESSQPSFAAKGNAFAFVSLAPELLPEGMTSTNRQIYVRDLEAGTSQLASVSTEGGPCESRCEYPSLSADGRYVSFTSYARDLVPGFEQSNGNVFRHDLWTGETTLASRSVDGGGSDFFERSQTAISDDGRYVVFRSRATNLIPGTNDTTDRIYVADMEDGSLTVASVNSEGELANNRAVDPAISGNGRFVAFSTSATNLDPRITYSQMNVYVHDRQTGETQLVSVGDNGEVYFGSARDASLSTDGRHVVFAWAALDNWPNDQTGIVYGDVVVKDLVTNEIQLASANAEGLQSALGGSAPCISAQGRYVTFMSAGNEFYPNETAIVDVDVWRKDMWTGEVLLVSPGGDGQDSFGPALGASMTRKGDAIVFASEATNHVPEDHNGSADIFLYRIRGEGSPTAQASTNRNPIR